MQTRRLPPTRTSILATGIVAPVGPNHSFRCFGSVHICHMRSAGASKRRSITTASWERLVSDILLASLPLPSELSEVVGHPVESRFPDGPVLLGPVQNFLERCGVDRARPVLGSMTPYYQPGSCQHLYVLRDSRKRQIERFGELVNGRLALRQAGEDSSPGRVRQHGEGLA